MKKLLFLCAALLAAAAAVSAQPRPVDRTSQPPAPNAPISYNARYEGGLYGSTGREKGTLRIDDAGRRVTFHKKDGKELLSIPFDALVMVYPDSRVQTSQTGNVVSRLPLPGAGLAGLITDRTQYLIMTFEDPEIAVKGTVNFKFENKKQLLAFIDTLGGRAEMKQRGHAWYRGRGQATY